MTNKEKQKEKKTVVPAYIDKKEFLNTLKNTLINDILYTQIKEAFPELIPERKNLTDKEIQNIFEYIRKNATRSSLCHEINEKINVKYKKVLEKYSDEIDKHNRKNMKFRDYSVSIIMSTSNRTQERKEQSLTKYTQQNLERIIARNKKRIEKEKCKRLQKV